VSDAGVYPTLYVNYTLNCTFTISDDAGSTVSSIPPGTYEVDVNTPILFSGYIGAPSNSGCAGHVQFQLTGPGVNLYTTLFGGCSSNQVLPAQNFEPSSTYVAQDNNQPSVANVVITTLASGSPTQPTPSYSSTSSGPGTPSTDVVGSGLPSTANGGPFRGTLAAAVSAAGKLTLTFKGKSVASLKEGRYTVTVVDHSKSSGFILQELSKPATTLATSSFTGDRSVSVDLTAGQWFFHPTLHGTKTYFIVIT